MIGKVIGIEENIIYIKLNEEVIGTKELIHHYVSLKSDEKCIIGEIINIKESIADVNLVGEMNNDEFVFGVISKPGFKAIVDLVDDDLVKSIISVKIYDDTKDLYLGKSPIYKDLDVSVNINKFFSQHFAIFGSTGAGKSCGVARVLQNLFSKKNPLPYKASIFIFDFNCCV